MNIGFATLRQVHDRLAGRVEGDVIEDDRADAPMAPTLLPTGGELRAGRGRYRRRAHHRDAA